MSASGNQRPNILWICTDQQRFDTLGCYGNSWVRTPNIDKLAQNGVLFEQAYCQSTVCTPSRASFLTGRYPRTTGIRGNGQSIADHEVLVTKLLHDAGYTCGLSGKLHLSVCHPSVCHGTERRIDDGYDMFHWSHGPTEKWPTNEYFQWLRAKGNRFQKEPVDGCPYISYGPDAEDHQATWCAEKAIEFIEAHEHLQQPWLFSVNIFAPHHPFDPPQSHLQRYLDRLDEIPLPDYVEGELEDKPLAQRRDHQGAYANPKIYPYARMKPTDHQYIRAAYWAMCDLIDEQVGNMLAALERTGQLDQTIVIFMSDHGELLGDHGMYLKGPHFYDPSVRVPLIISYPGVYDSNTRVTELVELLDLAPTLLEAAGLKYPGMQGKALQPLLKAAESGSNEAANHREEVFCEVRSHPYGSATMLRTQTDKIVLYTGTEGELYDLRNDPSETHNLWNDPVHSAVKQQMLERLSRKLAETVDPLPAKIAPW